MSGIVEWGLLAGLLIGGWKACSWLGRVRRRVVQHQVQRRSEVLAQQAIQLVGLPWKHTGGSVWIAVAEPKHGFRVTLKLIARDCFVSVVADCNFHLEREFVARDLLWYLLERNGSCPCGSFGVCPTKDGFEIVHHHLCHITFISPQAIAAIGRNLVAQMESVIEAVHAKDWV